MLAVAPEDFLDDHGVAAAAIDAPHGVEQKDQKSPERSEFVTPSRELIVTGRRLMATGTDSPRTFAWTHGDFDALVIGSEAGMLVNKAPEMMAAVWNRDELQHGEKDCGIENFQDKPSSRGDSVIRLT
jgi:hypothetical protein